MTLVFDLPENAFGQRKRLHVVADILRARDVKTVLDVGCGSGQLLTTPLARNFPGVRITGLDEDSTSVTWARSNSPLPNVRFLLPTELSADAHFDLIIASEVIEHVEDPGAFLAWLRSHLVPAGAIFLTMPNGFGPYEVVTFLYQLADRVGLRKRRSPTARGLIDTWAASPHINFFSFGSIRRLRPPCGKVGAVECEGQRKVTSMLRERLDVLANANPRVCAPIVPAWCVGAAASLS
jgi:SAM-dependent methyltransferase